MVDRAPARAKSRPMPLNGAHGVAALLLAMERDDASRLLKKFDEEEIKSIVTCAAELGVIPDSNICALVDQFEAELSRGPELSGSEQRAEELIDGVVPDDVAQRILAEIRGMPAPVEVWSRLPPMGAEEVVAMFAREHIQVFAYALSRLQPEFCVEVVNRVEMSERQKLFERVLDVSQTKDRPMRLLESYIGTMLPGDGGDQANSEIHNHVAGIMNRLDRPDVDELLDHIGESRPKQVKILRSLIFAFDDILRLAEKDRKSLIEGVPAEQLIEALKTASPELVEACLDALSGRNRRMVESEVQTGAEVPEEVSAASQRRIADLAIQLAQDGRIDLAIEGAEDE